MKIGPFPPKGWCISNLWVVGAALWRVLDFFEKAPKKAEHLPPSLHLHHLRDSLHTTLGGAHFLQDDEREWEDEETITTKRMRRRLEWLGHLARMTPERIPKITLFSWLPQTLPQGGPRRRWRDLVKSDLKAVGIQERGWYEEAQHRKHWYVVIQERGWYEEAQHRKHWYVVIQERGWYEEAQHRKHWYVVIQERGWYEETQHRKHLYVTCNEGLSRHQHDQQRRREMAPRDLKCSVCGRCFRRESDKARHKCTAERQKPVHEKEGAVECLMCGHWLRSKGG